MPKIYVDIAFGRNSEHPVMYSLPLDRGSRSTHETNLIVIISDKSPRRLGGHGWKVDPVTGEVNRGWLHHGKMIAYPKGGNTSYHVPEMEVAVKWVRGQRAIESLRKETRMYEDVLRPLQGVVVPVFYGLFTGKTQDGMDVACMLMEWCPGNDPAAGKPGADILRMRSLAVQSLHQAGVHHGQLYERGDALCLSDARHFLRGTSGSIKLVDFQHARTHKCKGEHYEDDATVMNGGSERDADECTELAFATGHSRRARAGDSCVPWDMF
ncbi:hypothetical protein C8Q80DRAFT_1116034 [Daedaleopsis nitida]|nr:hypothetical protein C8Q80DRAFT_1116034 [Daedaleopsis nitida]